MKHSERAEERYKYRSTIFLPQNSAKALKAGDIFVYETVLNDLNHLVERKMAGEEKNILK